MKLPHFLHRQESVLFFIAGYGLVFFLLWKTFVVGMSFAMLGFALIPVLFWVYIFTNKEKKKEKTNKGSVFFAFVAGGISTVPIFLYQYLFQSEVSGNFIFFMANPVNYQENITQLFGYEFMSDMVKDARNGIIAPLLGVFAINLGVGFTEEVSKQAVVTPAVERWIGILVFLLAIIVFIKNPSLVLFFQLLGAIIGYFVFLHFLLRYIKYHSVENVIEVALLSALGFAFIENIHYFGSYAHQGINAQFIMFALVRTTVVTIVHVLCSAVLGYYVGISYFAGDFLQVQRKKGKKHIVLKYLHMFFQADEKDVFRYEQLFMGLMFSIGLHALYDLFMQLDINLSLLNMKLPLYALVMPIYFLWGWSYVYDLFEDQEVQKDFGNLKTGEIGRG